MNSVIWPPQPCAILATCLAAVPRYAADNRCDKTATGLVPRCTYFAEITPNEIAQSPQQFVVHQVRRLRKWLSDSGGGGRVRAAGDFRKPWVRYSIACRARAVRRWSPPCQNGPPLTTPAAEHDGRRETDDRRTRGVPRFATRYNVT